GHQHDHDARRLCVHFRPEGADGERRRPGFEDHQDLEVKSRRDRRAMSRTKGAPTMVTMRVLLAATLASCLSTVAAHAAEPSRPATSEVNRDLLPDTIRANRKAFIAVNLGLTVEEAAKFWPLYERYRSEVSRVGNRVAELVEEYITHFSDLSNEKALQLIADYLGAE